MGYLNFFFIGDDVCLHSMDCCFDSRVTCNTHASSRDYAAQEVIALLTVSCQKGQRTGLPFILCSSMNIFGTQHEHNF
jgi:hypothetical protein